VIRVGDEWRTGDPLPPIGATLEARGGRDYVLIRRTGPTGWEWAVNNHRYEKCSVQTLYWAAPVTITEIARTRRPIITDHT
jgi:hypothetical protein